MSTPLLSLDKISKSFDGIQALTQVSIKLYPGQVTALIGENGAGKSTIVKILTGVYQPDEGTIVLEGKQHVFSSVQIAEKAGITAIHQETMTFDELSVAENIFIGHAPKNRFGLIAPKQMYHKAQELLERIGADINPKAQVKDLSIAQKHLVVIARALSIDAKIVILDEPTASLSHKEILETYDLIERLRSEGKAILFISHKFDEIFRIAQRFIVFRDAHKIKDGNITDVTEHELVQSMVGRSMDQVYPKRQSKLGQEIFKVKGYSHPTEFKDINFTLHKGEVLGFYGLVGSGRSEVMQSLFGMTRPLSGGVEINGVAQKIHASADAIDHGIVYVPEDRGHQGITKGMPIYQNVTLPSLGKESRFGLINLAQEFKVTREYTQRLDLRASSLSDDVCNLSGGNQQKVVIAKWLATSPKVIILDEPTKGVDISAKAAVHEFMNELAEQGLAIIMVSSEIPEVIGMSDRIIIMREGCIVNEFTGENMTPENLVRAAVGIGNHLI